MRQSNRGTHSQIIRILIAHKNPSVREGLASLLGVEANIVIVGQAEDAPGTIAVIKDLQPDVVLICVRLLRVNGSATTRRLCADAPAVRILAVDIGADPQVVAAMRAAGATGFVDTLEPIGVMLATIRRDQAAEAAPCG
jgi:DNA-binding NarL/FixJ family response regulator